MRRGTTSYFCLFGPVSQPPFVDVWLAVCLWLPYAVMGEHLRIAEQMGGRGRVTAMRQNRFNTIMYIGSSSTYLAVQFILLDSLWVPFLFYFGAGSRQWHKPMHQINTKLCQMQYHPCRSHHTIHYPSFDRQNRVPFNLPFCKTCPSLSLAQKANRISPKKT